MTHDGLEHGARDLRQRQPLGRGAFDRVDQALHGEEAALRVAGLGDAVGVDDDDVARLQPLLTQGRAREVESQQWAPALVEGLDDLAAPEEQRSGMAGDEVAQPARVQVELPEHTGGVDVLVAEALGECAVDVLRLGEETLALPAGVAVGGQARGRRHSGPQVVAGRVDDGEVGPGGGE